MQTRALTQSLRLRLLVFAGGAIALALAMAWAMLGILFERHAERQLRSELERHGLSLIAAATIDPNGIPALTRQPSDPRFARPASGLYWLLKGPNGELRSRSLWDGQLDSPVVNRGAWQAIKSAGPFEASVLSVSRKIKPSSNGGIVHVTVAADRAPLTKARREFERETAIFLSLLWLLLAAAAWFQVRMGLRPLTAISNELNHMSQAADARLEVSAHPLEVRPLTEAINKVANQRADDILRARQRAQDLAHALKTPLTALRLQIGALPTDLANDMIRSLSLVSGAVESELARAGVPSASSQVALESVVDRLIAVVSRTPSGATIKFHADIPADLYIPMPEAAALEAIGALIENASRFAQSTVIIAARATPTLWVTVTDNGPGIPADLRQAALTRGSRLDERSGSHGLGLAIAQDLVIANGGALDLEDAPSGGLTVRIQWPAVSKGLQR